MPGMFFEDVTAQKSDTLPSLARAYGHKASEAADIWSLPDNAALAKAGGMGALKPGDVVQMPIPWHAKTPHIHKVPGGVHINIWRTGGRGTRLSWVQTVYRHNQPIGPNPRAYCVDACTPDDDLPFYFTDKEITGDPSLRRHFWDEPSRNPPSVAQGTTRWRAVTSVAVVTGKRVTVFGSQTWGFNLSPAGVVQVVGPRASSGVEFQGHLALLSAGIGTGGTSFAKQGWTFHAPPAP